MSRDVFVKGSSAATDVAKQAATGAPKPPPVRKAVAATPLAAAPSVPSVVARGKGAASAPSPPVSSNSRPTLAPPGAVAVAGVSPRPAVNPSVPKSAAPTVSLRPANQSAAATALESKSLFDFLDASPGQALAGTTSVSASAPVRRHGLREFRNRSGRSTC